MRHFHKILQTSLKWLHVVKFDKFLSRFSPVFFEVLVAQLPTCTSHGNDQNYLPHRARQTIEPVIHCKVLLTPPF